MNTPPKPRVVAEDWYRQYYADKGEYRNSLLFNPEVLFQILAQDDSFYSALRFIHPDPETTRVLDVGCGTGASLINFLRLGFLPRNLSGVDFQEQRICLAKTRLPAADFRCGDATRLDHAAGSFDLVFESTMFVHCVDESLSAKIAGEMLRVTRPGGHILVIDWRYGKPGSDAHKAVTQKRISALFGVGDKTIRLKAFPGELVPPAGRFLSRWLPSTYFLVRSLLPFLVGQKTTVLRKL